MSDSGDRVQSGAGMDRTERAVTNPALGHRFVTLTRHQQFAIEGANSDFGCIGHPTNLDRENCWKNFRSCQQGVGRNSALGRKEKQMSEQDILEEISKKLSVLISLELQRDGTKAVQEHVMHLSRFGLTTGEVANILNTTAGTVAVAKSRVKRKTGGK